MKTYNLYIDESCHLSHDGLPVMCIGYIKVEQAQYSNLKEAIQKLKLEHKSPTEIKWSKLSGSRLPLYKALIDLFFEKDLYFRAILVKYKDKLTPADLQRGEHDNFYYKLVDYLLSSSTNSSENQYRVYLDVKDTRGRDKLKKIRASFEEKNDGNSPFIHFQHIHSHENEFLQLADLFIGAITYKSREEHKKEGTSEVKKAIVEYVEAKSGYLLNEGTEPWEKKFNIFDHQQKSSE